LRISAPAGALAGTSSVSALAFTAAEAPDLLHIATDGAGTVTVTATAGSLTITTTVETSISEPGQVMVPARKLVGLVAGFPSDAPVDLALGDRGLAVHCGRSRYCIPVMPDAEAPAALAIPPESKAMELRCDLLHQLLGRPFFCAVRGGMRDPRSYLRGVFLHHPAPGTLAAVATDGVWLCRVEVKVGARLTDDRSLIVPITTATIATKLMRAAKPATVLLRRSRTLVEITAPTFRLTSKLLDAADAGFPAYERLLPKDLPNKIIIDRKALMQVLARLTAVANVGRVVPPVLITWQAGAERVEISLPRQPGCATEIIDVVETTGAANVAISLLMFVELVEQIKGDQLAIEVNGLGAVRITSPGDPGILILQMPIDLSALGIAA
jgi:DNA polymerase-3 subunit beta